MTAMETAPRRDHAARMADRAMRPTRGRLVRHRFLILRRLTQLGVAMLFLTGPLFGVFIAKGTIAASMTLGVLPLTDPLMIAQSLAARHVPETSALIGGAIVVAFYALVSGRAYCAWVCPINPVTDLAQWCRERLGLRAKGWQPRAETRLWVLGMILAVSVATGTVAWELVNPITHVYRALVFGSVMAAVPAVVVFLFDLFVARRGWCSHLCPVGAFYGLIGARALVKISAGRRAACDHCMDCYAVCPEPQVISPALEGVATATGPLILDRDCTTCGRCIDVCSSNVFRFTHRFDASETPAGSPARSNSTGETP